MNILKFFKKDDTMAQPKPTWPPTLENSKTLRSIQQGLAALEPTLNPMGAITPKEPEVMPTPQEPSTAPPTPSPPPAMPPRAPVVPIPTDQKDLKEYLQTKVFAGKTSTFLEVMKVSDRLKDLITDDAHRAKVALVAINDPKITADSVAMSIDNHISDLETERIKAKDATSGAALAMAKVLTDKAAVISKENEKIADQLASLHASINRLMDQKNINEAAIATLNIQVAAEKTRAESFGTIDSTADAIKNDLIAKKNALIPPTPTSSPSSADAIKDK